MQLFLTCIPPDLYIRNISTSFSFNNEVCRKRWLTLRPRIFRTRKFATGPRIISDHCLAGIIRGTQLFPYAHSEGPCQFFEEFDTGPPTILKAIWTWSQEILMHKNTHFPSPVLLKIWTGVIIKIKNLKKKLLFFWKNGKFWLLDQASHHLFGKGPSKIYGVPGPGLRTGG